MIEPVVDVAELLNPPESRLEGRILRTLYRKGTLPEGLLANYVKDRMNTATWKSCIARLLARNLIHMLSVWNHGSGSARRIALTEDGERWAKVLCSNR